MDLFFYNKIWQELRLCTDQTSDQRRLEENQEARLPPRSLSQRLAESRSHTDSDQAPLPSERSENSRSLLTFWSENSHSRDLLESSLLNARPTWDSRPQPSWPSRKPQSHTLLDSSRTPISAPSMPTESPSCLRMLSWPEESEEININ